MRVELYLPIYTYLSLVYATFNQIVILPNPVQAFSEFPRTYNEGPGADPNVAYGLLNGNPL